jgi:hypothetical protein
MSKRLLAMAAAQDVRRVQFYSLADNQALRRLIHSVAKAATFSTKGGMLTGEFDLSPTDAAAAAFDRLRAPRRPRALPAAAF